MALIKDKIKGYNPKELLTNPNVQAMLKTIRYAEGTSGTNGYGTRVGGTKFNDFSKKPRQKVFIKSINDYSSAEGAYQFLDGTWDNISSRLSLKDFSPQSQDEAAVGLIIQRGAMGDLLKGNFETTINKLSPEWASLPKSDGKGTYSNQKARSINNLSKVFYGDNRYIKNSDEISYNTNAETKLPTTQIPEISSLVKPIETNNFVEQEKADKEQELLAAKIDLQNKQNEENLFQDLLKASQLQYVDPTQVEDYTQETYQDGGIIEDDRGQWVYPGKITKINSPSITMKNIPFDVLGIANTGERILMKPEQNYYFKGADFVMEYPQIKNKNKRFS